MMNSKDDEEQLLRSVALKNAKSILIERQRVERQLAEERERLRITLASIGDAVISTDAHGRVVFLNGVAEQLTGWQQADAVGRSLTDVFKIVNETTRATVENPALRALSEGRIVDLANHTVLISRDNSERPIDDSAAPMRDEAGATIGAVLVFRDVTERKRAEEAQLRLAAIVESSEDAILSKTLDGVIRSWNAGATRVFGYTAEEAVGKHISLFIPPDRIAEELTILARLRRGERIEHFQTVRRTKDGRRIDVSLTVSPLKDHEGRIIGASKIARDITQSKRAQEVLRESEERHRFLVGLAAATQPLSDPTEVMAITARSLCEHLDVNRCAYAEVEEENTFVITGDHNRGVPSIVGRWPIAAFGAECERQMRANQPLVIDDVDAPAYAGLDLIAFRQTNIQAVICVPLHKEGKLAAAMAVHQTSVRHWTPGEIELVRTVVARSWESIERTRVARDLKQAADHLALAVNAAKLGDWSWDSATGLITLSTRAAEIFGFAPGRQVSRVELQSRILKEDLEPALRQFDRAISTRDSYDVEYRVTAPNGDEVWVSAKGHGQYDANGAPLGMYGVFQNITERKQLEQQLRQRAEELALSDRKKDEFIALLAHELRNPLAPVRTGLEVMRIAGGDANAAARAHAMMDRQLSHMVRLVDDLLDVSRMSRNKLHLQKARVTLAEVVSHAIEVAAPSLKAAGHELSVALPKEEVPLDADLTRLAQVFGNLLTNAAKYTEKGGQICIAAEVYVGEVRVTVKDTGIGIPVDALPRVFDMFAQVDRSIERTTGGLGIGLALVKGLVEAHGGTVTADSQGVGTGSTFTVSLPLAAPKSDPLPAAKEGEGTEVKAGKRILIADDSEDGAASMAELLELLGHEVHVAHDGVVAVDTAERVRPDLVLMDVGMPRLNGLDATRQIRERPWGRDVTIVALTGWGQEGDRERSKAAGCNLHLVKPVSIPQLEKVLAGLPQSGGRGGVE